MLKRLLNPLLYTLFISVMTASPSWAVERVLLISGYADGLPFLWRQVDSLRATYEQAVEGGVVHSFSLDLPGHTNDREYQAMTRQILQSRFQNRIDSVVLADPYAVQFYDEHLTDLFAGQPVLKVVDFAEEIGKLPDNQFSVVIQNNVRETLDMIQHYLPDTKRLILIGDKDREAFVRSELKQHKPNWQVESFSHLSLDSIIRRVKNLEPGDVIYYLLWSEDGLGQPLTPPVTYAGQIFSAASVPAFCQYRNFLNVGCVGGSVNTPAAEGQAIGLAMEYLVNQYKKNGLDRQISRVQRLPASVPAVSYTQLQKWQLAGRTPLEGTKVFDAPVERESLLSQQPLTSLIIMFSLAVALLISLIVIRRQQLWRNRMHALIQEAPVALLWRDSAKKPWRFNRLLCNWLEKSEEPRDSVLNRISQTMPQHQCQRIKIQSEPFEISNLHNPIRSCHLHAMSDNEVGEVVMLEDITLQKRYEAELFERTTRDDLTGLANRRVLFAEMKRCFSEKNEEINPSELKAALLLVDLDRFRALNDAIGHSGGDQLLKDLAEILQSLLPPQATLARLGGDEFCAFIPDLTPLPTSVEKLAEILQRELERVSAIEQAPMPITASIGIAHFPADANDAAGLLRCADQAMYQAKLLGRNRYCSYRQLKGTLLTDHLLSKQSQEER